MAVDAPTTAFLLELVAEGDDGVGVLDDALLHPVHQHLAGPAEELLPDASVGVVPSVHDLAGLVLAEEFAGDERMEGDKRAVGIDDVRLKLVDASCDGEN